MHFVLDIKKASSTALIGKLFNRFGERYQVSMRSLVHVGERQVFWKWEGGAKCEERTRILHFLREFLENRLNADGAFVRMS